MKLGIFGGSFDPVHKSHRKVVEEAIKQLNLDKILVIPTKNNPWKEASNATDDQRLDMLHLTFDDNDKVEICTYEINLETNDKNYTIDTINHLKTIYPSDELYYIVGMDQASKFNQWVKAKEISQLVQMVAFDRIGYTSNDNLKEYNFIELKINPSDHASSSIRDGDLSSLDSRVLKYIVDNGIYLETIIKNRMSDKRYIHTLSMAKLAKEIAKGNGLNPTKAYVAGMLHDVAKEMDKETATDIMENHFPQYINKPYPIWHQWLSMYVAKHEFFVSDPEILQAIVNHTSASTNMSKLDMCIYVADKLDPSRDYDSSKEIELSKRDVVAGFKECLKMFYEFSKEKNREIDDSFFDVYKKYVEGDSNE